MTTLDLIRIARTVIPPVGASMAIAVVDHEPGGKLSNGFPSGIGGRTRFGVAFLVEGRLKSAPIALFERQSDALHLVGIINGTADPASRPAPRGTGMLVGRTEAPVGEVPGASPIQPDQLSIFGG